MSLPAVVAYTYSTEKYWQGVCAVMHSVNQQQSRSQQGFTIPELMITIAIMSVLMMIAVPSFQDSVERNSVLSKIKVLRTSLTEARDRATTLRTDVTVCGSADGTSCDGSDWHEGWIAWADKDRDSLLDADEVFMVRSGFNDSSTVTASATSVSFDRTGAASAVLEMHICPESNKASYARGMVVQASGIVRYSRDVDDDDYHEDNSGAAYTCP